MLLTCNTGWAVRATPRASKPAEEQVSSDRISLMIPNGCVSQEKLAFSQGWETERRDGKGTGDGDRY